MPCNSIRIIFLLLFSVFIAKAQDDGSYKMPPKDIADILLAKASPNISLNDKGDWMLFTESSSYPSVEELAMPELRIAGLRINPDNFAPSRQYYINNLYLKNTAGREFRVNGLPAPLFAGQLSWSPDDTKIAFTHTIKDRVDLYVIDVATQKAVKINKAALNVIAGGYQWLNNNTVLYRTVIKSAAAAPPKPLMPKGPTAQENYGKASPRPTFQDMIRSPYDEQLFEFYATTQLVKNSNGTETKIGQPAIYSGIDISPDKKYLLLRTTKKPFSYMVPAQGFPALVSITDINGKLVKQLADLPSYETAPSGNDNVQLVARGFGWRDDEAATVIWCMPLDSGLIKMPVDYHDAVYALQAPFAGEGKLLFKTTMRYRGITWGSPQLALVNEGLTGKQKIQTDRYNPATGEIEKLMERNTTDAYS